MIQFKDSHDIIELNATCISYLNPYIDKYELKSRIFSFELACSGTVIELNNSLLNSDRYLILFDNGSVSYIHERNLQALIDSTSWPCERLSYEHVFFLRNYFHYYPERELVRFKQGQKCFVYFNNNWNISKVIDLDASLVKFATTNDDTFWMYRGSFGLWPIYEKLLKKLLASSTLLFSLNEKCITKKRYLLDYASSQMPNINDKSNVNQFFQHLCHQNCVFKFEYIFNEEKSKNKEAINPLIKPILNGWQRCCLFNNNNNNSNNMIIAYKTPCGKMIRSIKELNQYLIQTKSILTIDLFSYDSRIKLKNEFKTNKKTTVITNDISNGKEKTPISCVNMLDKTKPIQFDYEPNRIFNSDIDYIKLSNNDCCSCHLDNNEACSIKSKCECWLRTYKSAELSIYSNCGYKSRRLVQHVTSGIFECNSKCKCNPKRCLNRVVQNGVDVRLQVFKTNDRGWGVRCLDDLAPGTFISTYSGELMHEKEADKRINSKDGTGYEYFAELDLVKSSKRNKNEIFILDPKFIGNIGRFFNGSCMPNMFVQNVFVDTRDLRFPWTAFFTDNFVKAGTELTWDYNYTNDDLSKNNKIIDCKCGSIECCGRLI